MSNKRIIAFIVFYIGIVLAILFTFFYVQDRYGHNPPRQKSGVDKEIISVVELWNCELSIVNLISINSDY